MSGTGNRVGWLCVDPLGGSISSRCIASRICPRVGAPASAADRPDERRDRLPADGDLGHQRHGVPGQSPDVDCNVPKQNIRLRGTLGKPERPVHRGDRYERSVAATARTHSRDSTTPVDRILLSPRRMAERRIALVIAASLLGTGCFRGGGGFRLFEAAFVTAAIVSSIQPPPPRVAYVPEAREGYAWQPGYWTRQGDHWDWVVGWWIEQRPYFLWAPTHWEQARDGTWQLVPGQWVPA